MFKLILHLIRGPLRTRESLILENVALRHQLQVLSRGKKRPALKNRDRLVWILLRRVWQGWRKPLVIVQPETVIRWQRQGFRAFWRRKSRRRSQGRPRLSRHEREVIQQMVANNPIWGVPRIHGELLKLGIEVSQTTVAKYAAGRKPPSKGWKTFLKNHSHEIVSVDFFTVPTITCQILYVFLMVENSTRRVVHFNVTAHPTMEWTARQLVEAFPWDTAPTYILRDRDNIYGRVFTAMVKAMGIEDVPTAPRSPWQNPYVERLIGTVRRDCLDHVIVFNERHLHRVLAEYVAYYNESRTHLGLEKECPVPRSVEPPDIGPIRKSPILGGLHHRYYREAA
jgi:putative transposase